MTKSEFDKAFNEKYLNALTTTYNPQNIKNRLKKDADENGNISSEALCADTLMISAEFCKSLIYSVLVDILELSD